VGTDRVGRGAFARPAQAKPSASVGRDALVRPGREATVPPPAAIPPHDFKTPQPAQQKTALPHSQSTPQQTPSPRKPPETAKPTPHERKIKAHPANRG